MSCKFEVELSRQNGNLHVRPRGDLDGSSAWELLNTLHDHYDGHGDVYIDTHGLGRICPFGCSTFQCRLNRHHLPAERLIFNGSKGAQLAPAGSRVIYASPRHHCKGNCARCRRAAKKYPGKPPSITEN